MSGSVITILSGKACSGKTMLALKLASVLGDANRCRVCLVELNLEPGDIPAELGLGSGPSLTAAMTADGHLDQRLLPRVVAPYLNGVDCLFASVIPEESEKISSGFIGELVAALRQHYDCLVIDTPAAMSSRVQAAIDTYQRDAATEERSVVAAR